MSTYTYRMVVEAVDALVEHWRLAGDCDSVSVQVDEPVAIECYATVGAPPEAPYVFTVPSAIIPRRSVKELRCRLILELPCEEDVRAELLEANRTPLSPDLTINDTPRSARPTDG